MQAVQQLPRQKRVNPHNQLGTTTILEDVMIIKKCGWSTIVSIITTNQNFNKSMAVAVCAIFLKQNNTLKLNT